MNSSSISVVAADKILLIDVINIFLEKKRMGCGEGTEGTITNRAFFIKNLKLLLYIFKLSFLIKSREKEQKTAYNVTFSK